MKRKDKPETMPIEVVEKTFAALERLSQGPAPLALARLAEDTGLPKPTLHRILGTLRELGYVEQEPRGGGYAPTAKLAALGGRDPDERLRAVARPLLDVLHRRFDETTNLGCLQGGLVRYLEVRETTQPLRWIVRPGARDPFHTTALGRAIAAALPPDRRDRLVARARLGRRGAAALRAELAATAARGWAIDEEETNAGVVCLARSLAPWGEPLAAISVSVPVTRMNAARRQAIVAALLALAPAPAAAAVP